MIKINPERVKEGLEKLQRFFERHRKIVSGVVLAMLTLLALVFIPRFFSGLVINSYFSKMENTSSMNLSPTGNTGKLILETEKLMRSLDLKIPRTYYLVINSTANVFTLYKGKEVVKTDKCSTGSYTLLKNGEDQQWMFKTPKGEFRIRGKTTSPVWKKPDWAFIEEGLPVPSSEHYSRYEYGVLGDYALSLGDGYLIHGTLYQRFLGLPVTHGCIRLNDENLELVYKSMSVGSRVYIF